MSTKQQFLSVLRRELSKYEWAKDTVRLDKAMEAAEFTLNGGRSCTLGHSFAVAWKEIGMKGKPTYKGLHALPESEAA